MMVVGESREIHETARGPGTESRIGDGGEAVTP